VVKITEKGNRGIEDYRPLTPQGEIELKEKRVHFGERN